MSDNQIFPMTYAPPHCNAMQWYLLAAILQMPSIAHDVPSSTVHCTLDEDASCKAEMVSDSRMCFLKIKSTLSKFPTPHSSYPLPLD